MCQPRRDACIASQPLLPEAGFVAAATLADRKQLHLDCTNAFVRTQTCGVEDAEASAQCTLKTRATALWTGERCNVASMSKLRNFQRLFDCPRDLLAPLVAEAAAALPLAPAPPCARSLFGAGAGACDSDTTMQSSSLSRSSCRLSGICSSMRCRLVASAPARRENAAAVAAGVLCNPSSLIVSFSTSLSSPASASTDAAVPPLATRAGVLHVQLAPERALMQAWPSAAKTPMTMNNFCSSQVDRAACTWSLHPSNKGHTRESALAVCGLCAVLC